MLTASGIGDDTLLAVSDIGHSNDSLEWLKIFTAQRQHSLLLLDRYGFDNNN